MRTPPPFDLSGRAALVTGAGSPTGIGYAAARLLGDLGASLTLAATTDRVHERAAELGARGIPTLGVVGDLTREEDASSLVAQAYAAHGRLDILVANAGLVSALDGDYLAGSIEVTVCRAPYAVMLAKVTVTGR